MGLISINYNKEKYHSVNLRNISNYGLDLHPNVASYEDPN